MNTQCWVKCESKGRPADTLVFHGTTRTVIMQIAGWLNKVYMGSHIEIRLARTEAELSASTRNADAIGLAAELDALLGGTPMGDIESTCTSCNGLNLSCPEGCERDQQTGELTSLLEL